MRNKKPFMIIAGVLAGVVLVAALLAAVAAGFVFYAISTSEAAETARAFLRENETLKADIGEVRDFGYIVTGNLHAGSPDCDATIKLKAIGARRSAQATVNLLYRQGRQWRVCGATYANEAGKSVKLFDPYAPPSEEAQEATPDGTQDGDASDEAEATSVEGARATTRD